jgi:outer membrane protein assembly factor BamB
LIARDTETGTARWEFTDIDTLGASPAVAGGVVFVGMSVSENDRTNEYLFALDATEGTEQWRTPIGDAVSPPTVADGRVAVCTQPDSNGDTVKAVDVSTGDRDWSFQTELGIIAAPTVADGRLFAVTADEKLYAIDWESGDQIWQFDMSFTSRPRQWSIPTDTAGRSGPTVVGETLFVGSADGVCYAIDTRSGQEQYRFALDRSDTEWGPEPYGSTRSSPVVVDGTLYIGASAGGLYAFDTPVEGSSRDSRVLLQTNGHHEERAEIQPIEIEEQAAKSADGFGSGFGTAGGIAGVSTVGYMLARRRGTDS